LTPPSPKLLHTIYPRSIQALYLLGLDSNETTMSSYESWLERFPSQTYWASLKLVSWYLCCDIIFEVFDKRIGGCMF
jgi:hypothetical protein